jgi:hypothetical protein
VRHARERGVPVMSLNRFFAWWKDRGRFLKACAAGTPRQGAGFGIAVPAVWNGRRLATPGKLLGGTGEVLVRFDEMRKVAYTKGDDA